MTRVKRILKTHNVALLFCFGALVCLLSGAASSPAGCFELSLVSGPPPELSASKPGNSSVVVRQRTVFINPSLFIKGQSADYLLLNLFEDVQLKAVRQKFQRGSWGSMLWTGALVGAEPGSVVLIVKDQRLSATVFLQSVTYQIRPFQNDLHIIRQINNPVVAGREKIQSDLPPDEWKVTELVNRERAAEGLQPLQCSEVLSMVSRNHAAEMAGCSYYSHDRRDGRKFYEPIFETGYPVSKCGENIAVGLTGPEEVFEGWIHSPEHRANILNSDFTEMGVGNAVGNNKTYWALEFGAGKRRGFHILSLAAISSPLELFRAMGRNFEN